MLVELKNRLQFYRRYAEILKIRNLVDQSRVSAALFEKRPVNKSQRSDFSSEAVFNPGPGFKLKVLFRLLQPTRLINIKSMTFQLAIQQRGDQVVTPRDDQVTGPADINNQTIWGG